MPDALDLTRRAVAPLTRTRAFRRFAPGVLPSLERFVTWLSGGRLQLAGLLVPALELRSIGAKTGAVRVSRLMYTPDGPGCAIVAGSNFAKEGHPAWTTNLRVHPDAEIVVQGRTIPVHATEMGDDERDAGWARIEAQWPGYRGYERESGRTVRLFRLRAVLPGQPGSPGGSAELGSTAAGSGSRARRCTSSAIVGQTDAQRHHDP